MENFIPASIPQTRPDGLPNPEYIINQFLIEALENHWAWKQELLCEYLEGKGVHGFNRGQAKTVAMSALRRMEYSNLPPVILRRASQLLLSMTTEAIQRKMRHQVKFQLAQARQNAVDLAAKASAENAGNRVLLAGTFYGPASANLNAASSGGGVSQTLHPGNADPDPVGKHRRPGPASAADDIPIPHAPGTIAKQSAPRSTGGFSHIGSSPGPIADAREHEIRDPQKLESVPEAEQVKRGPACPSQARNKDAGESGRSQQRNESLHLPAEQLVTSALLQARSQYAVRVNAEEETVRNPRGARPLRELTPNAQGRSGDFATFPPPENQLSTTRVRKAVPPKTPNVANSSDAVCNFGSPLLPLGGSGNQEEASEGSAASHQLSLAGAQSARRFAVRGRRANVSKRSREGVDIQREMEPPAKSPYARYLKARKVVLEMETQFPEMTAALNKLLCPNDPAHQEAATGAQIGFSAQAPKAQSFGAAMQESPPMAPPQRSEKMGVQNSKSAALQAETAPTPQATATRVGAEEGGGAADRELSGVEKSGPQRTLSLNRGHAQAGVETGEAGGVQDEAVGGSSETETSISRGIEPAVRKNAENHLSISSTGRALAAVKLGDQKQPEAASYSPPPSFNGELLTSESFLRAPGAVLHEPGEGRAPLLDEHEATVTAPKALNIASSGLAVSHAGSVNATETNGAPGTENSRFKGFKVASRSPEENNSRRTRKKWFSRSNPPFDIQSASSFGEANGEPEKENEEEHTVADEVAQRIGQSSEAHNGMEAQNDGSKKLNGGVLGSECHYARDDDEEEEPSGGAFQRKTAVPGLRWPGGEASEGEKGATSAAVASGTSVDGAEKPRSDIKVGKKIGMSIQKQQLKELGLTESAANKKFGPFLDCATLFPKTSGEGGQQFKSLDRILDSIQAPTDYTFGEAPPQDSRDGFFALHAASPTGLATQPFVPRAPLLNKNETSESLPALRIPFPSHSVLTPSRTHKSDPQPAFQKLKGLADTDDENEEEGASALQGECESGERFSKGSMFIGQRTSDVSAGGDAAAQWGHQDAYASDEEKEGSDCGEFKEGGRLQGSFARKEGGSWGKNDEDDVSPAEAAKAGAKRIVGSGVNRYSNLEPSPVSAYKASSVLRSPSLDSSPIPIQRRMPSAMGLSLSASFGNSSNAGLGGSESHDFDAVRKSAMSGDSVDDPQLIAEMAKLLGQEQLEFSCSQQATDDSYEGKSMSISAAYGQGSKSDDEEDDADSAMRSSPTVGMNETEKPSLATGEACAGAAYKTGVATREDSYEGSAAGAGAYAGRPIEAAYERRSGVDAELVKKSQQV